MKRIAYFVIFLLANTVQLSHASDLVHGQYTSICAPLNEARRDAPNPTDGQISRAAGCKNYKKEDHGPDCKQCGNGQFVCRGTARVWCPADEKIDQQRTEREAQEKLAREKADRERAEKAAAAKAAKAKADQQRSEREALEELARQKANRDRAEKIAAAKAAKEKSAREKADRDAQPQAARSKAGEQRPAREVKSEPAARPARAAENNPVDDAFSRMERQTGRAPTSSVRDIDGAFGKLEASRAEQVRVATVATQACQAKMKQVATCFEQSKCAPGGEQVTEAVCRTIPKMPEYGAAGCQSTCEQKNADRYPGAQGGNRSWWTSKCEKECRPVIERADAIYDRERAEWRSKWSALEKKCDSSAAERNRAATCQAQFQKTCNPQGISLESCIKERMARSTGG